MDNYFLLEEYNAKQAFTPVDLNAAAITGNRVSLAANKRVAVVISVGASTAALLQVTLKQHNAATAGTSKDLSVANKYYVKAGAATSFTQVEPTVAAALYDLSTDFAANAGVIVFEVLDSDLDVNNGFTHFSIDVADSTAAKIGAAVYILRDSSYQPAYSLAI
jgi:hypothetical protein